jgi:hypothetical protein
MALAAILDRDISPVRVQLDDADLASCGGLTASTAAGTDVSAGT